MPKWVAPSQVAKLCSILMVALVSTAKADTVQCPKAIATVEQDQTSRIVLDRVEEAYKTLGCETEFVPLPAVRGVMHFNKGLVDGEVFRLRQVEPSYARAFVRSTEPVMILSSIEWQHPQLHASDRLPLGYLLGVVWQEAYMKDREGRPFHRPHQMYEAYNKGELRGFLATDIGLEAFNKDTPLRPYPRKHKVVMERPVYHYVAAEYAAFIEAFSQVLHEQKAKRGVGR